jgi:hypothetical protein
MNANGWLTCKELSFSLKYPEPHLRDQKDPYSIREIGIHHKMGNLKSDFIFIQLPERIKKLVENFLQSGTTSVDYHHLRVHAVVLLASSKHWRPYISYLELEFSNLVRVRWLLHV